MKKFPGPEVNRVRHSYNKQYAHDKTALYNITFTIMTDRHKSIGINYSDTLKTKARELGFTAIGIARAEELKPEKKRLLNWLGRNCHSGMAWMERNTGKRADPRIILEGAQSVITVALNYWNDAENPSRDPQYGKISRYAWGGDYHDVLGKKLRLLLEWLQKEHPGMQGIMYVDTGPVLEKAWAVKSGIGWLGKHTNVILKNKGSWFFLGVLIVDIFLEYDEPVPDFCGTCTACIDACPTGALVPYQLDAGKCISYWTIEHKGDFPDGLSSAFENWIFGCDICQEVCPWNRFSTQTAVPEFTVHEVPYRKKLNEWEKITEIEFKNIFQGTPLLRPRFGGFLRNVKNAIRNSLSRSAYTAREKQRKNNRFSGFATGEMKDKS